MEGRAKEASKLVKPGEWNHFKLQAKGDTVTTWINGTKASERRFCGGDALTRSPQATSAASYLQR